MVGKKQSLKNGYKVKIMKLKNDSERKTKNLKKRLKKKKK